MVDTGAATLARHDDSARTIAEQREKVAALQNEVDRLNAELVARHRRRPEPKQKGNVVYLGDH
ncbi:MAG: hypothetical protein GEU92_12540 [Alphaproteobacteria bacterium]|nr:hypothetical protein [Alphaproteobacteria bacterium]